MEYRSKRNKTKIIPHKYAPGQLLKIQTPSYYTLPFTYGATYDGTGGDWYVITIFNGSVVLYLQVYNEGSGKYHLVLSDNKIVRVHQEVLAVLGDTEFAEGVK